MKERPDAKFTKYVNRQQFEQMKEAPELHIHVAATLVKPGDPHSIQSEKRQDLTLELGQYAVRIEPQYVGRLKMSHINQSMRNLEVKVVECLRKAGAFQGGQ